MKIHKIQLCRRLFSWSVPRRVLGDFLPLFFARRFFSSARRNSLFILRMRNLVSIRVTRWRTRSSYKSENLVFNKTKSQTFTYHVRGPNPVGVDLSIILSRIWWHHFLVANFITVMTVESFFAFCGCSNFWSTSLKFSCTDCLLWSEK